MVGGGRVFQASLGLTGSPVADGAIVRAGWSCGSNAGDVGVLEVIPAAGVMHRGLWAHRVDGLSRICDGDIERGGVGTEEVSALNPVVQLFELASVLFWSWKLKAAFQCTVYDTVL